VLVAGVYVTALGWGSNHILHKVLFLSLSTDFEDNAWCSVKLIMQSVSELDLKLSKNKNETNSVV
jgi:hypothetical protein